MIGWLIYDYEGAERNKWFIDQFITTAEKYSIKLLLKIVDKDTLLNNEVSLPDFAIIRIINPEINNYFENLNIPTFNNFKTSKIANNKWLTYEFANLLNIPTMKTFLLSNYEENSLNYPFVVKSLNGHGGTEVYLVHDKVEIEELKSKIDETNFIVQELCSNPGKDMRVYVLGKKIIAAILRESKSDFRSNFSLGGKATLSKTTIEQKDIINKVLQELDCSLVGIDFIYHNNQWVLNEIEDVVGTRMLYSCTDINIVDLYLKFIKNVLS